MDFQERAVLKAKAAQSFKPGTPINRFSLFAGRQQQVSDIIRAINLEGQHVVLFGERGVGKTSLSKVLVDLLTQAGIGVIYPENINCDGTDDFPRIWAKVFRELIALLKIRSKESERSFVLDEDDLYFETPDDIRFVLGQLPEPAVIVLDEIDRITDESTPTLLADTIKNLSDHATPSTLILIGVADSIDELITEHKSVERAIVQVHLPRMSPTELQDIIDKGSSHIGVDFVRDAAEYIVRLSAGLPHYTHSLALLAVENAIDEERLLIGMNDVNAGIKILVNKPGNLLSTYERATQSSRETLFRQILLACALAPKSDLGFFSAVDVRSPLEKIMGRRYEVSSYSGQLNKFCSPDRDNVLQKSGIPRQSKFRFTNPLLQPFVIIHGLAKGLLDPEILAETDG